MVETTLLLSLISVKSLHGRGDLEWIKVLTGLIG